MSTLIDNNAKWLEYYDSTPEYNKLLGVFRELNFNGDMYLDIVDIGCGTGRSTNIISTIFPRAHVTAIDCNKYKIDYAINHSNNQNNSYYYDDAYSFFSNTKNDERFDIAFFSWSLFDMVSIFDYPEKEKMLTVLIDLVKQSLKDDGCIIVTQPTKGGEFEKLLSMFMPGSDMDYYITHHFLSSYGFVGPSDIFPHNDGPYTIWSSFQSSGEDLYCGVAAVIELETGQKIDRETFEKVFTDFKKINSICDKETYNLSDRVNLYYWRNK